MQASDSDSQQYDRPRFGCILLKSRALLCKTQHPYPAREGNSEPRKSGSTIVNRPFSAFATLMTLLALAMFAVSSTNRSTTVRPLARSQGSGVRSQPKALEVSDQKAEIRGRKSEIRNKQIVTNAGKRALMAVGTGELLRPLAMGNRAQRSAMQTIQVVVAEDSLARECNLPLVDCRSHYDPAYDFVVYGVRDFSGRGPVATQWETTSAKLADELDGIFQELVSRQAKEPLPQAGAMKVDRIGIRWRSLAAAIGAWMNYQVGRGSEARISAGVGWADYAEFAGRVMPRSVTTVEAAETSDAE